MKSFTQAIKQFNSSLESVLVYNSALKMYEVIKTKSYVSISSKSDTIILIN